MTERHDDANGEDRLIKALQETWAGMDETFEAKPSPLPNWTAMVREGKAKARRKMWRDLAILWSVAVPVLGGMALLLAGMQTLFWVLQAAATAAGIPWLISEFRQASRPDDGRMAP